MEFSDIFKHRTLTLPKNIPQGKTYREFIGSLFESYLALFESVESESIRIRGMRLQISISSMINRQRRFTNGFLDAIDTYFDGQPAQAYEIFNTTMNERLESFKTLQNIRRFLPGENFYRIRIKEENYPLGASEMFHIPFQYRGRVTTQRFSIPGFPSLYLGKTIYVAWEELKRPSLDRFQAVRLEAIKPISCLDLTRPDWGHDPLQIAAYRYLMIWPLIAGCSIRVSNPGDSFKPEYIIPQLLLQWVRNVGVIDGIIYASTNIKLKPGKQLKDLYNIVLPVKDNTDEGLCTSLTKKFEITSSISKQLLQSASNRVFLRNRSQHALIDAKIPPLEIIRGRPSSYSSTELGYLEMILDEMETYPISPKC
ncbi:MAG: RES family NAD+ phosphorylase [Bacteroidota bacterium]